MSTTAPPLLRLPQEIRDQIWDILGHNDDYTALLHACSQIRSEILDRLPHRRLLCHCQRQEKPHWKPDCQRPISVEKLSITVGAGNMSKCYLGIEAVWKAQETPESSFRVRKSAWVVRNRRSVFAKFLKYYRAKETVVVFEAPRSSFRCVGLLVALAKMCDTMPVIGFLGGELGDFSVHFSEHGPGTTAFWERRIETNYSTGRAWGIDVRPMFYECVIIPFLYGNARGPYDTKITFERPPAKKSMLLKQTPGRPGLEELNWVPVESCLDFHNFVVKGDIVLRWRRGMVHGVHDIRAFFYLLWYIFQFYASLQTILKRLVRKAVEYGSSLQENPTHELKDLRCHFRNSHRGGEAQPEQPEQPRYFPGSVHLLENQFAQWASTTSKFELCWYCYGKKQRWTRCRSPTRSDSGHSVL